VNVWTLPFLGSHLVTMSSRNRQVEQHSVEAVVGSRKHGSGYQYEIKWHGQPDTTWEGATRVRKQNHALVEAFEERRQSQSQQGDSGEGEQQSTGGQEEGEEKDADMEDGTNMRQQMEALQQLVREQSQQLQQLRSSPAQSPQQSPRNGVAASSALPAAPAPSLSSSRFARKEPRTQDLREYDGASGTKLDEWLDELGVAVRLFHLNGEEAMDFGTSRLRGAALQWWNALDAAEQARITTVSALTSMLRSRFQPITADRTAREQLQALRQGSRSINDYIADFQRLRALLPKMEEADALFAFERGLSSAIALEIRKQGSTKLADALALAARIGGITASASGSSQPASKISLHQMELEDGSGSSLGDHIARAVVNAMQSQQAAQGSSAGFGAKTQTHRGYFADRGRGGSTQRGGSSRPPFGRGGGSAGGNYNRPPPVIPGVPAEVIQQRWDGRLCLRCGSGDHRAIGCPDSISAHPVSKN
jgi:hypothetical protein